VVELSNAALADTPNSVKCTSTKHSKLLYYLQNYFGFGEQSL